MVKFPKFVKVAERAKDAFYRFEGVVPHAVALYLPENVSNTESGSVTGASIVLDWISH